MQLHKLMNKMAQGTMSGDKKMDSGTNYWDKAKAAYKKNMMQSAEHMLNMASLHVRNGGRGNAMGMAHQNQHHHRKSK
ncbi:MAG: hypothetical protein QM800_00360 [Paludibacter sp.]